MNTYSQVFFLYTSSIQSIKFQLFIVSRRTSIIIDFIAVIYKEKFVFKVKYYIPVSHPLKYFSFPDQTTPDTYMYTVVYVKNIVKNHTTAHTHTHILEKSSLS